MNAMSKFAAGLALAAVCACGPSYGSMQFELRSTAPLPVRVEPSSVEVPTGIAVAVRADPQSTNTEQFDEYYQLRLEPRERGVLDVLVGPREREYVMIGVGEGETCVEVIINEEFHECIAARVGPPGS